MIKEYYKKTFLSAEKYNLYSSNEAIIKLERKLCKEFNVNYTLALNSGTSALHCALIASGISEGDEVIVPALSVVMTIAPIIYQKAIPVFVDCQRDKIDFDYEDLQKKITTKTKAIIPVHLWGFSYNMTRLKKIAEEYGIIIIEDACQALGSKWDKAYLGTIGDYGCFSMKDGKIISTGEGGFLLIKDNRAFEKIKYLRTHDFVTNDIEKSYNNCGYNYRLTNFQAILAYEQLAELNKLLQQRKDFFSQMHNRLHLISSIDFYKPFLEETPNYSSPVFFHKKGKQLSLLLSKYGVANSVGSFGLKPAYEREFLKKYVTKELPNVSFLLNSSIALSLNMTFSKNDIDIICDKIIKCIEIIS